METGVLQGGTNALTGDDGLSVPLAVITVVEAN